MKGLKNSEFNSYGSRRGNEEVMVRGTFANVRIKNKIVNKEGGYTIYFPNKKEMSVFDAAMKYKKNKINTIVFGGKEYGSGSSRDWAAKGTNLLGIKVIICESFERIHRSNLVGMGILPIELYKTTLEDLSLNGEEFIRINFNTLKPNKIIDIYINERKVNGKLRIDSDIEIEYYKSGGILNYVLNKIIN